MYFCSFTFCCLSIRLNPLKGWNRTGSKHCIQVLPRFQGQVGFHLFLHSANFKFRVQMGTYHPTVLGFTHHQGMMLQALSHRVLKVLFLHVLIAGFLLVNTNLIKGVYSIENLRKSRTFVRSQFWVILQLLKLF